MSKYVFVVHSSITFRMAGAIIEKYAGAAQDAIFLTDRGFNFSNLQVQELDISKLSITPISWKEKGSFFTTMKVNRKHRKALDQLLTEQIGTTFKLFIPHSFSYTHWALILHPLCGEYAFVEEGTLSYLPDLTGYLPTASRMKKRLLEVLLQISLGPGFPVFPQPFEYMHPKYAGCYGISVHTFPTLPAAKKVLLPPPFTGDDTYKNIKRLLITGPWVERNFISLTEYRQLKTALFQYLVEKGVDSIHVKFHPDQYHQLHSILVFREVAAQFADRVAVIELPPGAAPEEIAFSSKTDFFMAISSVAIYAKLFGCRVFTYAPSMGERWPVFQRFYAQMPDVVVQDLLPLPIELAQKVIS